MELFDNSRKLDFFSELRLHMSIKLYGFILESRTVLTVKTNSADNNLTGLSNCQN